MSIKSQAGTPLSVNAQHLGKRVLTALYKQYPSVKEGWCVTINEGGGIIHVINTLLSGKMGFVLHITQIDAEGKTVMRAGGELLERYAVRRHPHLSLDEAMQNVLLNHRGEVQLAK